MRHELGLEFPPSYRRFVLDFGAGSFGASEVYGVIDSNFENSSVPDAVWCTLDVREFDLTLDLVVLTPRAKALTFALLR